MNERELSGEVRYLNEGADFVIQRRRDEAYRTMYNHCGGKYLIVREWDEDEEVAAVPIGRVVVADASTYRHIEYECVD